MLNKMKYNFNVKNSFVHIFEILVKITVKLLQGTGTTFQKPKLSMTTFSKAVLKKSNLESLPTLNIKPTSLGSEMQLSSSLYLSISKSIFMSER